MEAIWPIVLICLAIPVLRLLMGVRRYQPPAQEYHREDYQEEPVRYQRREDLPGGGARPEVDYWEQRAFQRAREKERER